jgi:SAM-dependent methyltransferase
VDWSLGRYEIIAAELLPAAAAVVDHAAPRTGERVLDLGCGTGNAAFLAAQRGARVIGVDPTERLLDIARSEAAARSLDVEFLAGDAGALPLGDGDVDVVVSVFGVIFAPDAAAAAAEIARVSSPAGRIALSAWIPRGPVPAVLRLCGQAMAAAGAPAAPAPFPWHEREALESIFAPHGFAIDVREHDIAFAAASPADYIDAQLREHPLGVAARARLGEGRLRSVREGAVELLESANEDPDAFRVTSSYVIAGGRRRISAG